MAYSKLHPGTDDVFRIQGSGFLFGPALRLGSWLGRGFGLCGGLALLRTLGTPGSGLSPLGRCTLGLLHGCVARCKHGVFAGGSDVGLGRGDRVLQLEHLLGHEAKHFLGILQGVGRVCGPGEEPVPSACPVAAHVGRVAGGVACPRWGAFLGEGAFWRPLRPVEGVVQRFSGCLWGVGDACGEWQAVPSAWWGWDFVVGGVCRCPSDLAVVAPSTVHQVSRCLRMWTSVVVGGASMASQLTSWMGRTWGWVFRGARMLRIWWMSSAVGPVPGASCAAWARGGKGRSSQRQEADAVAYMAAIRTCSVSPSTMRWFSPSRSRGMVASAFRVRSAMARLGPGVACVGSSGGRP